MGYLNREPKLQTTNIFWTGKNNKFVKKLKIFEIYFANFVKGPLPFGAKKNISRLLIFDFFAYFSLRLEKLFCIKVRAKSRLQKENNREGLK